MKQGVIITGGAKRVGAHMARQFAQAGYDVALHYNHSRNEAEALQQELESHGVSVKLFMHDLADTGGIAGVMKDMKTQMPHCSVLINNASVFDRCSFMDTDEAMYSRQFDINFKAPFFLTQAFAREFGQGTVINMLDTEIDNTGGSHFAYLLSKKALADFTQMAARDLGPAIRVHGLCLGCIIPSGQNDAEYEEKMAKLIPLRAHPSPEEVCEAALWLVQQKHMTGQLIYIDGGRHVL